MFNPTPSGKALFQGTPALERGAFVAISMAVLFAAFAAPSHGVLFSEFIPLSNVVTARPAEEIDNACKLGAWIGNVLGLLGESVLRSSRLGHGNLGLVRGSRASIPIGVLLRGIKVRNSPPLMTTSDLAK